MVERCARGSRVACGARCLCAVLADVERARIGQRVDDRPAGIGEAIRPQRDAVPRELRRERIGALGERSRRVFR